MTSLTCHDKYKFKMVNLILFLVDHSHYKLLIERLQQASTKEEEVVDLTEGTNVCIFCLSNLSSDISFLVHVVYDFSGLFIREIFLQACFPVGRGNIASPSTKLNIFTWFWH